jgi:hypothetical protein
MPFTPIHSIENGSGALLDMKVQGLYTEEPKIFAIARYTTFGVD